MRTNYIPPNFELVTNSYANTSSKINRTYTQSLRNITTQGIEILDSIVTEYIQKKNDSHIDEDSSEVPTVKYGDHLAVMFKKKATGQEHHTPEKKLTHQKSANKLEVQHKLKNDELINEADLRMVKQMKKLSMSNRFQSDNESENHNTCNDKTIALPKSLKKNTNFLEDEPNQYQVNYPPLDEQQAPIDFGNKSLNEIIQLSDKKVSEKSNENFQFVDSPGQLSEYQLTDYSSNQSSNDNDYRPEYREQSLPLMMIKNKPLFGGLFGDGESQSSTFTSKTLPNLVHNGSSQGMHTELNFKPYQNNKIMDSPKKTKKGRRLYIREKKIPQWAEDLSKVSQLAEEQKKHISPKQIFGKFFVEQLNSNVVFQISQNYQRTSSAKWNYNKVFVE